MNWTALSYDGAVAHLQARFGFGFVAIGIAPQAGEALRWRHVCGATSERYRRIVLSPGHGIGGIVLKTGKPMMFTDIDRQLDPREYSSYPIIFAEDLRSFCAVPLISGECTTGVLLCAFRAPETSHERTFAEFLDQIADGICGFQVETEGFLKFDDIVTQGDIDTMSFNAESGLAVAEAREGERRAISRQLHDGFAQDLLVVSMMLRQIGALHQDEETLSLARKAERHIDQMLENTRDLSVQLRPLALDDLGLGPALRTQAGVYRKMFGADIRIHDFANHQRFDRGVETQAYRIAQEAMLNACKYSRSDVIDVIVSADEDMLSIAICDQGIGFDTSLPTVQGHGCGMESMRERAAIVGGTLRVRSSSSGTTVSLRIPIP